MAQQPRSLPARQIRALYDKDTITVYQAYNTSIASAAVESQKLNASPLFKPSRMTWIKPSWCWMMYRSGYSHKDANQSNILAIRVKRSYFEELLGTAVLTENMAGLKGREESEDGKGRRKERGNGEGQEKKMTERVRVQWDPERSVRIGRLEYRSIQIGIPEGLKGMWIEEGIVGIEDVTERAREMKRGLDEDGAGKVTVEELLRLDLMPEERVYELPEEVARVVGITEV